MQTFFLPMKPPTATFQGKKINWARRVIYDAPETKAAKQKLIAHLSKHVIEEPMEGAIILKTVWIYQANKKHLAGTMKETKPDVDNMQKLLLDAMTELGFWKDDAQVAVLTAGKYYGDVPGIFIEIIEESEYENN